MREEINGMVFINGILCDGSGRPITERNGYSSEDEEAAIAAYNEAKKNCVVSYSKNYNKPKKKSPQAKNKQKFVYRKYSKKLTLEDETLYEVIIEGDFIRPKYRNDTLCNESGEEISIENGYSDEDAYDAKMAFKEYIKNFE